MRSVGHGERYPGAGGAERPSARPGDGRRSFCGAQITTRGEVKAIDLQSNKITLSHPAIPEVDWPAMTMRFTFDQESQVAGLKVGDRVTFSFVQQGAISRLTAIHVI